MKEGEYFGEKALLGEDSTRGMTIEADKETVLLSVDRASVASVLGRNLRVFVFRNKIKNILHHSPYFRQLSAVHHERVIDSLDVRAVEPGLAICQASELCANKIFFVLEGEIVVGGKAVDHRNIFFGEECLVNPSAQYALPVTAISKTRYAEITYAQLMQAVGGDFRATAEKVHSADNEFDNYRQALARKRESVAALPLEDFVAVRKLGAGEFGAVYLVY